MKNSLIKTLARLPELTTAIAIVAALLAVTAAAEIPTGKGGATLLAKPASTVSGTAAANASCSSCKDVYVIRTDATARGANKPEVRTGRHLCQSCSTTLVSVGTGKSKHDVANHQCSMATARNLASCCGEQNGAGIAGCGQK